MRPNKQDKKNVLVLGGYGFLGSAMVRALLDAPEYLIYVIDKLEPWTATSSVQKNPRVQFLNFDVVKSEEYVALLPERIDYIVHSASSVTNVGLLNEQDSLSFSVDAFPRGEFLTEVLQQEQELFSTVSWLAKKYHVAKLLYLSTKLADARRTKNPFGSFKHEMEKHIVNTSSELPYIIARLPLQFGIFQSGLQFIPGVILQLLQEKDVLVTEAETNCYPWSYVDDTAMALRDILRQGEVQQIYSLPGTELSIRQVCDILSSFCESQSNPILCRSPLGNVDAMISGNSLANSDLLADEPLEENNSSHQCTVFSKSAERSIDKIHALQTIEERLALTYEFYEDNHDYYCKKTYVSLERGMK